VVKKVWNSLEGEICLLFIAYLFFSLTSLRHIFFSISKTIPIRFVEQGAISIYASDIFYILLVLVFCFEIFYIKKISVKFTKLTTLIAIFALVILVRAVGTLDIVSIYNAVRIIQAISIFFIARYLWNLRSRQVIVTAIIGFGLFEALLGISQTIIGHDLGLRMIGEPILSLTMNGVAKVGDNAKILRSYGTFLHPNIYAAFLLLSFYFLLLKHFIWKSFVRNILLSIIIVGLVLSFSRAAYAGLAFLMIYGLFKVENKKKMIYGLLVGTLLLVVLTTLNPQILKALEQRIVPPGTDRFLSDRSIMFQNSLRMSNRYITGTGPGLYVFDLYKNISGNDIKPWQYEYPHSMPIDVLIEAGVLGLLLYLFLLYRGIYSKHWVLLVSVIPLVLFDHFFWTLQTGRIMFWLILSFVLASNSSKKMFNRELD